MKFQLLQFFKDYLNLPKVAFISELASGWDFSGSRIPSQIKKFRKSRNSRDRNRDIKTSKKSRKKSVFGIFLSLGI